MLWHFEFAGPVRAIRVRSALDLAEPISLQVCAWPWRALGGREAADVAIGIAADIAIESEDGWRGVLRLPGRDLPERPAESPLETASALFDVLIRLCLEQLEEQAGGHGGAYVDLHAGSALIDGRLVAMPGPSQAGKSTLALQLAARGHALGGDDRLLIGPFAPDPAALAAMTLGLNARVRLPLHATSGNFAAFVDRRLIRLEGLPQGIGFLAPRSGEAAAFGVRAPLAGFVVPQRRDGGGIALEKASASDIMRQLLEQTHAPHLPVEALVAAVQALAGSRPGYVLRYDDSAAAAAAIETLARDGFRGGVG